MTIRIRKLSRKEAQDSGFIRDGATSEPATEPVCDVRGNDRPHNFVMIDAQPHPDTEPWCTFCGRTKSAL